MSTISFFSALVDTIERHYGLPTVLKLEAMPSPRSNVSETDAVYRVMMERESYVLRSFRTESMDAIKLHRDFLIWSNQGNFACAQQFIRTADGADLFEYANHRWWLAGYIEADRNFQWTEPSWSESICELSGKALAGLHSALREFGQQRGGDGFLYSEPEQSVIANLENKVLSSSSALDSELRKFETTISHSAADALKRIRRHPRALQLVHGDFHPGNILFKSNQPVAIIDFEYLHLEDVLFDVAYALIMFCSKWRPDSESGKIDVGFVRAFMRGYLDGDVKEIDYSLLDVYLVVAAIVSLTWLLDRPGDRDKALHFINVIRHLENFDTMDVLKDMGKPGF